MSVLEHKDDLKPWTAFSSQRILYTLAELSLDIQLRLEKNTLLLQKQNIEVCKFSFDPK